MTFLYSFFVSNMKAPAFTKENNAVQFSNTVGGKFATPLRHKQVENTLFFTLFLPPSYFINFIFYFYCHFHWIIVDVSRLVQLMILSWSSLLVL